MPASQRFTDEQLDLYLLEVEPHIDGPTLRWIDTIIRRSDAWEGLKIVPIHGDFSPRNWLASEATAPLGVIDWEISRPGYFVEDFQRMMQDHWLNEPQLRDAFYRLRQNPFRPGMASSKPSPSDSCDHKCAVGDRPR